MLFENNRVLGIAAERGVGDISHKRNETDNKVDNDIPEHLDLDGIRETVLDLTAGSENHEGHQSIESVADSRRTSKLAELASQLEMRCYVRRNYRDGAAPTEADAAYGEQAHVETPSSPLDLGQDPAIVFGNARRDGLLALLDLARGLAVEPRGRNGFEVWVLVQSPGQRKALGAGRSKNTTSNLPLGQNDSQPSP